MALTQVQAAAIAADAIDEGKLADNSLDSEHYNDGSIDNAHLSDNAVSTDEITNSSVTIAKLSASGTASNTTFLRGDNTWSTPADTNTQLSTEQVQDIVGAMFTGNTETNITATYQDSDGTIDLVGSSGVGGATGVDFNDNVKIRSGTGNDLEIYHDGSNSYINDTGTGALFLKTNYLAVAGSNGEQILNAEEDGAVELYYDNAKKVETTSGGIEVTGGINLSTNLSMLDNGILKLGTGDDLQLYHDGSDSSIKNTTGQLTIRGDTLVLAATSAYELYVTGTYNGAVELYYDNAKKFETSSGGVVVSGSLEVNGGDVDFDNHLALTTDDKAIKFGASGDLQIKHDGTNNIIHASNGYIQHRASAHYLNDEANSINFIRLENSAAKLCYGGNTKLETTSAGGILHGTWTGAGGDNKPAFSAYTSSTFDLASDTWVKQLFQTEEFDSDSAYDASTSTFTVPSGKGGKYQLNTQVSVDDINQGAYLTIGLYINGSLQSNRARSYDWSPDSDKIITCSMNNVISLSAGDTVNIYALHSGTGTQSSENHANWFSMFRLAGV